MRVTLEKLHHSLSRLLNDLKKRHFAILGRENEPVQDVDEHGGADEGEGGCYFLSWYAPFNTLLRTSWQV